MIKDKNHRREADRWRKCIDCNYPMSGILCYSIREICCSCGGESLVSDQRREERENLRKEKNVCETA